MQELVGRLTALDPEASESLKVITYFDALVSGGAGTEALLRAAAALSGATAGATIGDRTLRRDPSGRHVEGDRPMRVGPVRPIPTGEVWLEREGEPHANDEMVVERLALATELVESRHRPDAAIHVAIDHERPSADRLAALARLRLDPGTRARAIAVPLDSDAPASVPVATGAGMVRAVIDDGSAIVSGRAGLGMWGRADALADSWRTAVIALRVTDGRHPIVDATDLGAMLLMAEAYDPAAAPHDVRMLAGLDARSREVLTALVEAESLRAASAALGMHHSSVQARHESLTGELGYDPRSPLGRARYVAADLLLRLGEPT